MVSKALNAAVLVAIALCPGSAYAQSWPTRPVKLIVSTGPGLATDIMARMLSDGLSRQLGQQVFVENKPGAAGMIGAAAAARAGRVRRPSPAAPLMFGALALRPPTLSLKRVGCRSRVHL